MSKIVRKTASIFASSASADQIAQFGSLFASSPAFSTDPAVIQSLSNWLGGWFQAVEGQNSPAIEDMNAFCYVMAYQIAYLLQQGVAEYDSGTTYYSGSIAASSGINYASLTDNNSNNALTNPTYWGQPVQNSLVVPLVAPANTVVQTGKCMWWPGLSLSGSQTLTGNTGSQFITTSPFILAGSSEIILQGTATGRVI